ncbi:hypothetical protein C3943_02305 [Lysinibacillus sp. B2A1]|nr:hypothetical protein C3943_02305 [Lysinibacillus sp. B2A1]
MSKAITELAVIIKNGGNTNAENNTADTNAFAGFYVGTVEAAPPEIKVRLSPEIILYNDNLIISAAVLKEYEREFEIFDAEIQFTDSDCGQTNVAGQYPHSHTIESLNVDSSTLKAKGKLKWTDELKKGDKVILVPAQNENLYILIEKAVEL